MQDIYSQAFAREFIDDIQEPVRAAVKQSVLHHVVAPHMVWVFGTMGSDVQRHRWLSPCFSGLLALQPQLNPQPSNPIFAHF